VTRFGYYNSFRGKPAITKFGWPFTPTQKSLQSFATLRNETLSGYSPRGLPKGRSLGFGCNRAVYFTARSTCWSIIQKVHRSTITFYWFVIITFSCYFAPATWVPFSIIPSQYWFTIVHLLFYTLEAEPLTSARYSRLLYRLARSIVECPEL